MTRWPGALTLSEHDRRVLAGWAADCAERTLALFERRDLSDTRPHDAIDGLGREPESVPWRSRWMRWPDFRLPSDPADACRALADAWEQAGQQRVEVACAGGRRRTGTALACLAVLDGVAAEEAVAYVRWHYDNRAVETPWQRRYVARFVQL